MSVFPDFLYRLTPRDRQVTTIEPVFHQEVVTTAATSIAGNGYTVPKGRYLIVNSFGIIPVAGAAQTLRNFGFYVNPNGDVGRQNLLWGRSWSAAATATRVVFGMQANQFYLPEGSVIFGRSEYDAGAAANQHTAYLSGLLIPRGNFEL